MRYEIAWAVSKIICVMILFAIPCMLVIQFVNQHFYSISCIIVDEVSKMGEYDKYFNKDLHKDLNKNSHIKHVIAVTSGKGGVGKSLMTSLLAVMMHRIGYNVGILDADITGPSIPQAFGLTEKLYGNDKGIIPAETRTGIKIVSLNLMLDNPTDPVVWCCSSL